jgi:hypothetical protein
MKINRKNIITLFKKIYNVYENHDLVYRVVEIIINKLYKYHDNIYKLAEELKNNNTNYKSYYSYINSIVIYKYITHSDIDDENMFLILASIKEILYDCLCCISYDKLRGVDELKQIHANFIYYDLIIVNNELTQKCFKLFILFYYINTLFIHKQHYIGIDFEFNSRKIALMQINFEDTFVTYRDLNNYIFIIYPPQYDTKILNFFKKNILCNSHITKILHGSDSLDIPYMFYELFENNKKDIIKFTKTIVDTKYLCECYNKEHNLTDNKCKIYEALKNMEVISSDKFDSLMKNDEDMGHIYEITIDINNLSRNLIFYAIYDVLFLKYLYGSYIISKSNKKYYTTIIPEITQLVFLEKREITSIIKKYKVIGDSMNNYMTKNNKTNTRLNDMFDNIINNINIDIIPLDLLLSINYFKSEITILLKYITYYIISQIHIIYITSTNIFNDTLSISEIISDLEKLHCNSMVSIIKEFKEKTFDMIDKIKN